MRDAEDRRARRQVETALRESEATYRMLFETAGDAIFVADAATGLILDANRRAERLVGRPVAALVGLHQLALHPPEKRADYCTLFQRHALASTPHSLEVWVRHADGRDIPVEITTTLMPVGGRRVALGIFRDITTRTYTDAALRESEARYRNLVELSPDAIYIHQDNRVVYMNPAGVALFGATNAEELIGKSFWDLVHVEDRAIILARTAAILDAGQSVPALEERFLRLDGTIVEVEVTAFPFTYQERPAIQVVAHDIRGRKQTERQALFQRDLALELAAATSLDAALRACLGAALAIPGINAGGIYLVNSATDDLELATSMGISPAFATLDKRIAHDSEFRRLLIAGRPIYSPYAQIGNLFSAAPPDECPRCIGVIPILHPGRLLGSFNVASFIADEIPETSRRLLETIVAQVGNAISHLQAEEEISQRTAQLDALNRLGAALASTLDLTRVYQIAYEHLAKLVDTDGFAITLYDPAVHQLRVSFVISDGEVLDLSPFPVLSLPVEAPGGRARAISTKTPEIVIDQRAAAAAARGEKAITVGKQPLSAAYVPMVVNGQVTGLLETQSVRLNAYGPSEVALLGPAANQIGLAIENARLYEAMQRELGERTRIEGSLEETLVELQRSNADLEQFAYVASHDLQEPLRMVGSFVQLLGDRYRGQLDADADDFIGFAVEGATRMRQLINDLLEYSRVNRVSRPFGPTDVEAVLARALRNLEFLTGDTGLIITHDPLPTVTADASQLTQVFQNLLDNAIKFHGVEPPRVHITARQTSEGSETSKVWEFSVRDNGIGIDPEYQERIFGVFSRLHTRDRYSGNGIGLAICKKVIERHGGRMWVESALGAGATFYFTIPADA